MGREDLLSGLQQQIFLLMKDLREILPAEKRGLIQLIERAFELKDEKEIMAHVVKRILPHKKKITERDEDFFLSNKHIFQELPEEEVSYFGKFIIKGNLTPEEKERVWSYFNVFVVFAEEYKKMI